MAWAAADIRADAYLAKPFDLWELLDQVDRVIGGEASAVAP